MKRRIANRLRRIFRVAVVITVVVIPSFPAQGANHFGVSIREVALDESGLVRFVVSVSGEASKRVLAPPDFRVTEQKNDIPGFQVQPLFEVQFQAVAVVLAMDVSGSTRGKPLQDAKEGAKTFLSQLPEVTQVALIGFGPTAELRADFTTDRNGLANAIDGLDAGGETALYDAVALASSILARFQGQHNIVLFSDGGDTVSKLTLEQAADSAAQVGAPITAVALSSPEFDQGPLDQLAATTGGRSIPVARSVELAETFRQVAREIGSQYVISYQGSGGPAELDLSVSVVLGDQLVSDSVTVLNPRTREVAPDAGDSINEPASGFDSGIVLGVSGIFLFVALTLLLSILLTSRKSKGLKALHKLPPFESVSRSRESQLITTKAGRRALAFVENAPKPKGYEDRIQLLLDRAGWPLRVGEFLLIRGIAGTIGLALGIGMFRNALIGLFLLGMGVLGPRLLLKMKIDKRSAAFYRQLPDTLQICSGSLEAGYGLMQVFDTVVKESSAPTSTEFNRVLTETRLGMPIEESLERMSERIGGTDFRWVVLAINIQRQSGGNLGALLSSVADTLRERQALRRQIKVLSAEGRISAVILILLPFFLAGFITVTNPEYLATLFAYGFGRLMVVAAAVFMIMGVLWMRKIIRIEI